MIKENFKQKKVENQKNIREERSCIIDKCGNINEFNNKFHENKLNNIKIMNSRTTELIAAVTSVYTKEWVDHLVIRRQNMREFKKQKYKNMNKQFSKYKFAIGKIYEMRKTNNAEDKRKIVKTKFMLGLKIDEYSKIKRINIELLKENGQINLLFNNEVVDIKCCICFGHHSAIWCPEWENLKECIIDGKKSKFICGICKKIHQKDDCAIINNIAALLTIQNCDIENIGNSKYKFVYKEVTESIIKSMINTIMVDIYDEDVRDKVDSINKYTNQEIYEKILKIHEESYPKMNKLKIYDVLQKFRKTNNMKNTKKLKNILKLYKIIYYQDPLLINLLKMKKNLRIK